MKIYYAVLLVCSFAFNCTMAQSVDTIGPKMIEEGLIAQAKYAELRKQFFTVGYSNEDALLILFFEQVGEMATRNDMAEYGSFALQKPSAGALVYIKPKLDEYAEKLYRVGLIDEDMLRQQLQQIAKGDYMCTLQITQRVIDAVQKANLMQPAALIQVAEALYKAKLVSTKYEQLLQDIAAKKLKAPYSFLFYLDNVVFVNDSLFTNVDTTRPLFENVYKRTASILPQLAFSNYTFELEENYTFEDWITVDYKVALSIQGKVYRYKSYFSSKSVEEESSKLDKTPSSYFNVFNKALADMQSAYRLLTVPYGNIDDAGNSPTFAVLALTQQQIDTLGDAAMFIGIEPEYYKRSSSLLPKQQIDEALATFKQIGLFKHLSDEAIDSARLEIDMMLIDDINLLLSSFPDVIHPIYYEMVNMDNPYEELLQGYAAISHGEFNPTDIKENFNINRKHGKIQFKLNGTQYKYKLKIDSDWIDDGFLNFIDSVVKANHLKGRFYELLYVEGVIYLSQQQHDTIKQQMLLDFTEDFVGLGGMPK